MVAYTAADRLMTDWLVDRVVAVSSDIEKVLIGLYGSNRGRASHNGIDLEAVRVTTSREAFRRKWQIPEDAVVIGTVGRLVPVKGMPYCWKQPGSFQASIGNVASSWLGMAHCESEDLEANAKRLGLESLSFRRAARSVPWTL